MGAGLYIHIPFCRRKCLYCDFASWEGRLHDAERYVRALLAEMERYPERPRADTIYVGGGTPSLLPPGLLARILERARLRFRVEEDAEITLEANPGTVSMASLREYRAMGINRLSLGMQAAQDALLARLGRIHTVADFLRAAREAREAGFDNLSADIMSGLPGQRARDLAASIRTAAEAGCAHISLYTLKIEPGTPFAHRMALGELPLPGEDEEYDMTMLARDTLAELGYRRYEISN
ncbi:MAG: radical SAM family heme chaperone HemW, partial [Christensenellales bacterium]